MLMTNLPIAKIAFAAPLTGDQAIVGIPMSHCAELAVSQANARGDLPCRLVFQAEDDQADSVQAQVVARRLVADPEVMGIVGHKNSGPSAAGAPVYSAAGLVQLVPSSTNPSLSRQGYRTFFRLCAHDAVQGRVAAQYAVRALGARRVAVIHDQTDYGRPLAEMVQTTIGQEGAEVVLFEGIREGQTDFGETVARLGQLAPDLIYFALTEIESSILARQLRAAGVQAALFGTDGSRESQFLPLAGEAAEGVYQTYAGVDPDSTPAAQSFVAAFQAQYGPAPVYGLEVYDATNLLIAALARAGRLDRERVRQEVAAMRDFVGVTGPVQFDAHGDRLDPQVSLWRVEGGQMRLLGLAGNLIPTK
ncbi:MAG: branched-chain amino acid ABC transporter substrate-binding protein [Anaerolineae bacterium]